MPFNAPKKYWDLYEKENIEFAENPFMPVNSPRDAWFNYRELRGYSNIRKDTLPIPDDQAKMLRHGYYACISYIDEQIGQIIKAFKKLKLYDNTIIVDIGDHGWSLGEHSLWCKHSCFSNALRTQLIVKSTNTNAGKTDAMTSFVDIYPSLCELVGLEKPSHLDGQSFIPILKNPKIEVNKYIFCRWENGETVKSDKFIYTEYFDKKGNVRSQMLYNHEKDPNENENVVDDGENIEIVKELKNVLSNHFQNRCIYR